MTSVVFFCNTILGRGEDVWMRWILLCIIRERERLLKGISNDYGHMCYVAHFESWNKSVMKQMNERNHQTRHKPGKRTSNYAEWINILDIFLIIILPVTTSLCSLNEANGMYGRRMSHTLMLKSTSSAQLAMWNFRWGRLLMRATDVMHWMLCTSRPFSAFVTSQT